jgi:hypothetical protein
MHDLNSDERGSDEIRWTAGGRSRVVIYIDGERIADRELQKSQRVIVAYEDRSEGADR